MQEALLAAALLFYWTDILAAQDAVAEELDFIQPYLDNFTADLPNMTYKAAKNRAALYATNFTRFIYRLSLVASPYKKLRWRYTPEAHHCGDCQNLDGVVKNANEWLALGLYPRSGQTECLMNCKCYFEEV